MVTGKATTLATPPGYQCYDCAGCGVCCRGVFAVRITPEERARIEAQGWADDPEMRGQTLFVEKDGAIRLANRPDGPCAFLNEDGLCRIHARFGEPAKPLACRLFPFMLVPVGGAVRIDIRYDCPAVASNHGHAIPKYRSAMLEFLPQVIPPAVAAEPPAPLFGKVRMSWPQLCRLAEGFERIMVRQELDLTRRIAACVNLAAALRTPRLVELEGRKLSEFLEVVVGKVVEAAAQDALRRVRPSAAVRPVFRQVVAVYGRDDRAGEAAHTGQRLGQALAMTTGLGQVPPLRRDMPAVSFAQLEESFGIPDAAAAEALVRYFRMRFTSMGFFGRLYFGRSFLDGLNALLLTYPAILWYARIHAAGQGRTTLDAAGIQWGLQLVDRRHARIPLLNLPSERARMHLLTERSTLRSLVVWYGA